ncbi:MAG: DUF4864 domain-containing protein [Burkholderiales bacterium PBB5]|nr:MAG: DUF4864 domain-containing protein [Burkholderiales bacterium PBB5]
MPHTPTRRQLLARLAAGALLAAALGQAHAGRAATTANEASAARAGSDADARAVRAVIEAQLKAFAADDAVRAFSYAAPAIRTQFGDPQTFLSMVRQGYPVVFRPASTAFFQPEWVAEVLVQVVQMRDAAGRAWLATYQLQRQSDKTWRISGCAVLPDSGKAT